MPARPAVLLLALAAVASFAPVASAEPFYCIETEKREVAGVPIRPLSFCVLTPEARR